MFTTILLFFGFVILLTGEFFLPTGGLLGILASILIIAANVNAFSISTGFGAITLGTSIVVVPIMLMVLVQIWPHTPIGSRILNLKPSEVKLGNRGRRRTKHRTRDGSPLDELIGKSGVAKNELLPSGLVLIDGHKYDAISLGEPIEKGANVVVVSISAGKIQVRISEVEDPAASTGDDDHQVIQSPAALEIPLDSLDFE